MAKIAVELEQAGERHAMRGATGRRSSRLLAQGAGWTVEHLICTSGPQDRSFEEQHAQVAIAIVVHGTFQYRAASGPRGAGELMTPGSLLLGNAGQYFECGHEHGAGDRCLSFHYAPDYFERIAAEAGAGRGERLFRVLRLPALRALSELVSRASAQLVTSSSGRDNLTPEMSWEELGIELAALAVRLANGGSRNEQAVLPSAVARVTRAVRVIDEDRESALTVRVLAREAGLSPYHFLRTFEQLTGVTPHQYVQRARLREAAMRLTAGPGKVLDIAMECGFGDVSNFNKAFRREFGVTPRTFRMQRTPSCNTPRFP